MPGGWPRQGVGQYSVRVCMSVTLSCHTGIEYHQTTCSCQPSISLHDIDTAEREERRIRTQVHILEEERLCMVCGEKAGKHSYYGGQVIQLFVE